MDGRIGGDSRPLYISGSSNGLGKKSLEWDLNEWKWDGDLFLATPLNEVPSSCRSKQLFPSPAGLSNSSLSWSDETELGAVGKGRGEAEKRRRIIVEEDNGPYDEARSLTLNLGAHPMAITEANLANWEGKNEKKSKLQESSSNRTICQVEGCGSNLGNAKDYHRRHKVCEMHAKASKAVVGNVMQRFCQQCSRFHLLQEFDEGKRSCRRRLAGHNRRRRKPNPEAIVNVSSSTDDRASSYLLITLLRILSNLHSDGSDQSKGQDLLYHLLKNLASLASSSDASNLSGLLQASQAMHKIGTSITSLEAINPVISNGVAAPESFEPVCSLSQMTCTAATQSSLRPIDYPGSITASRVVMASEGNVLEASLGETVQAVPSQRNAPLVSVEPVLPDKTKGLCSLKRMLPTESTVERVKLRDFDLNDTYNDSQDCIERCERSSIPLRTDSLKCPTWMLQDSHQLSPPQTSGNSDSTSTHSLCNSNGDAQGRTDRIVFKLFGKDPNDLPLSLRGQVLDWLSHSPTDVESYIRPGCVILTLYLRQPESSWKELYCDLSSSLSRLLCTQGDVFWRRGWLYARVQHQIAFIYNGQVVLEAPLLPKNSDDCNILSITPIAVPIAARVGFTVKRSNFTRSSERLMCAFEGKYLVPETPQPPLVEGAYTGLGNDGSQCCTFYCSLPNSMGRGFIEVEDNGLSSGFFPFVVAEEDVCDEIRMLESIFDVPSYDEFSGARNKAIDFLHEMGWLLRTVHLRSMACSTNVFPLTRFRWLVGFSMDRGWCAVMKKLLDLLFEGNIELGQRSPVEFALSEDLLHGAVGRKCMSVVEFLLRYSAPKGVDGSSLFKPDMVSSSNITPLHVAASISGAENVLDALTNDPLQLGIKAWNSARDCSGFTPEDYARSRGFESYLLLVQTKSGKDHTVLDIPGGEQGPSSLKLASFQISNNSKLTPVQQPCKICAQQQVVRRCHVNRSLLYRPLMLSMVGIAAVCVCVGLLLKGPPEVLCINSPFRWEKLDFGWI